MISRLKFAVAMRSVAVIQGLLGWWTDALLPALGEGMRARCDADGRGEGLTITNRRVPILLKCLAWPWLAWPDDLVLGAEERWTVREANSHRVKCPEAERIGHSLGGLVRWEWGRDRGGREAEQLGLCQGLRV